MSHRAGFADIPFSTRPLSVLPIGSWRRFCV
jgi:hypothetical protein